MDSLEDFFTYDTLLFKPFSDLGWEIETVSWRNENVNWDKFEAVIIRSTWDYQSEPERFIQVLEKIDNSKAELLNGFDIVKWNINKKYIGELEKKGITIVPTIYDSRLNQEKFIEYFNKFKSDEIIIKPLVSANADNTFRLTIHDAEMNLARIQNIFKNDIFMAQPFIRSVIEEGEYSLFFFGENYSHCILKTPKENDFRVQEEHGGKLKSIIANEEFIQLARNIISKLPSLPLYSRVDLVRLGNNSFGLMELELIEPSLYFNMNEKSPELFARVFQQRMDGLKL